MRKIKVLIADDHAVVRAGLRVLISIEPDLEIAGEAENGNEAVALARKLKPDVVLLDVAMPECNGAKAAQAITKQWPAPKVLVLSAYNDDNTVRELVQAGAAGYLTKHTASEELVQAIREVSRGNSFFSAAIAKRMRHQTQSAFLNGAKAGNYGALTSRESEVLKLIAEGRANKQIGVDLSISIKTVEKHRQTLMDKLDIHDTAGLTRYAFANGVIGSNELNPVR